MLRFPVAARHIPTTRVVADPLARLLAGYNQTSARRTLQYRQPCPWLLHNQAGIIETHQHQRPTVLHR